MLDRRLLELIACPKDRGPLELLPGAGLLNRRLALVYPIAAGVPQLLEGAARPATAEELEPHAASGPAS